jgi:virginiamycin B lyase
LTGNAAGAYAFCKSLTGWRPVSPSIPQTGERAMHMKHYVAMLLAGISLLAYHGAAPAETAAALTGMVRSAEEGPMGGVTVTASRDKSSISVTATTDNQGRYSFPANRLAPGEYALSIRAVGYDLDGKAAASVAAERAATTDIRLKKTRNLSAQLSSAEWLASWPGTDTEKRLVADCMSCHTLERIARSTHTAEEWVQIIPRMLRYAQNTIPLAPQLRTGESTGLLVQQPERLARLAEYLATVNLSTSDGFPYELKALKRVSGSTGRAIVTTYKLPKATDQPHDVMGDPDGGIYFTYFGDPALGRLDPKTGEVKSYPIPILKETAAKGALSLYHDHDGNFWVSLMYQAGGAKFDKATKTFTMLPVAPEFNRESSQQAFVAPQSAHVDGKLWIQDVASTSVYRVDLKTGKFENLKPFADIKPESPLAGRPHSIYEIFPDAQNNLFIADFSDRAIGRIDAKTGAYSFVQTFTDRSRPRRGEIDKDGRLWFAEYAVDNVAMLDTKTNELKEWSLPTKWSMPYQAKADRNGDIWTGGMASDRITRINSKTGAMTEYQLPVNTNIRNIYVDDQTAPVTLWFGNNHGATIVKLEPLD